jgi:DNA-binding XRE family transcriptional regulator
MDGFGPELRRRRHEAGLSLSQLADLVHYHKGHLSKVENGRQDPSEGLARQCDAALGAGGELLALARPPADARPAGPPGVAGAGDTWVLRQAPDQTLFALLTGGGAAGELPALVLAAAPAAAVSDAGLAAFAAILAQYRQLGHSTGPAALLPPLIAQARILISLARQAPEPRRSRLLVLAGQYAEYAGWLAQEAGDDRAAVWWTDLAADLAGEGGNPDMAAHALVRKALVSMYREDAQTTISLAAAAQRSRAASQRIRGLAALREAQGHALIGDRASCWRALDRAQSLLAAYQPETDDGVVLGPTNVPDPVQMTTGWCLLDLGQPAWSAEVLDQAMAAIPATANRSLARYGARRALAYSAAREVERACALTAGLLDAAELVDSATIRIELRSLRRSLSRWAGSRPVQEILPRLAHALA